MNLHTFSEGCEEVDRMLAFRDWLRMHDEDREQYLNAKRELAAREWKFVQNYADAKSAVVTEILGRALSSHETSTCQTAALVRDTRRGEPAPHPVVHGARPVIVFRIVTRSTEPTERDHPGDSP